MWKEIKGVVIVIALMAVLGFGIAAYNYGMFAFWSPKIAAVQNKTFKESTAYNDGMVNDLADLRLQYISTKEPGQKDAIAAVVRQRFASYPKERLPSELRDFYFSL